MDSEKRRRRVEILSRVLGVAVVVAAVLIPVLTVLSVVVMSVGQLAQGAQIRPELVTGVSLAKRVALIVLTAVPAVVFSWALVALLPALRDLRRGAFFSTVVFRSLRRFAGALVVVSVLRILVIPLAGLVLTAGEAQGSLSISIDFDVVQSLMLAAGVWLMAWVLAEGAALAEENRQFV